MVSWLRPSGVASYPYSSATFRSLASNRKWLSLIWFLFLFLFLCHFKDLCEILGQLEIPHKLMMAVGVIWATQPLQQRWFVQDKSYIYIYIYMSCIWTFCLCRIQWFSGGWNSWTWLGLIPCFTKFTHVICIAKVPKPPTLKILACAKHRSACL